MKKIIAVMLLTISSSVFAQAFVGFGVTGSFDIPEHQNIKQASENMILFKVDGINIKNDEGDKYSGKVGFGFLMGISERKNYFDKGYYTEGKLLGFGLNFPIKDTFYIGIGGHEHTSKLKYERKIYGANTNNETLRVNGIHFSIGAKIHDDIVLSVSYISALNTGSISFGYKFY